MVGGTVRHVILVVGATEPELAGVPTGIARLLCGVGPIDAAAATAAAIIHERPSALLHVGIAGARRTARLPLCALVLGSASLYADASGGRFVAHRLEPDGTLLAAARAALPEASLLEIATSARVGGGDGAPVEAMEGFAVLRAAALAGVPAVELRAISNVVEEPDRARWNFDGALAALEGALPRVLAVL
jgi:nucleoside phosphorylase